MEVVELDLVNLLIKRVLPWSTVEFCMHASGCYYVRVGGDPLEFRNLTGVWRVRPVSNDFGSYLPQTVRADRIEKILAGWVRNDKGELVPPGGAS